MGPVINREIIRNICQDNQIKYLGLFGSYARGDNRPDSDIDLLIEFGDRKSLFDLMRVKKEFEDKLDKEVDLVLKNNIKPLVKPYIEQDLMTLYEKG